MERFLKSVGFISDTHLLKEQAQSVCKGEARLGRQLDELSIAFKQTNQISLTVS